MAALTVLVADDSRVIRALVTRLLTLAGCIAVTAKDGFDVLGKVVEVKPDLIFLDIVMPRLNGYDACALIKNNQELTSSPVILLSSKDGLFDKAKGRVVGCDGYLTKPFSSKEFIQIIENSIGEQVV